MQNRSIFPYRRHGPKKRVKHGPNRKSRGPHKGLPNSARDLLPLLQPATKALAQVLAGRTGASGQLGHARSMLAQAERMIAERTHNRLTPAEREEFFEQLARLKLTLADADAEAEVQAVEEQEPRPQAPPVAQERLKEMALALSMRERPSQPGAGAQPSAPSVEEAAGERAEPSPQRTEPAREAPADPPITTAGGGRGRLVLPKATAEQAAQAVAFGALARRRSRASRQLAAAATEAARAAENASPAEAPPVEPRAEPQGRAVERHEGNGVEAETEDAPHAKPTARRTRKPKHQGLPEGWVIDEEGFVVPGAG